MTDEDEKITLVHGAGGSIMGELIENLILPGISIKKALISDCIVFIFLSSLTNSFTSLFIAKRVSPV